MLDGLSDILQLAQSEIVVSIEPRQEPPGAVQIVVRHLRSGRRH